MESTGYEEFGADGNIWFMGRPNMMTDKVEARTIKAPKVPMWQSPATAPASPFNAPTAPAAPPKVSPTPTFTPAPPKAPIVPTAQPAPPKLSPIPTVSPAPPKLSPNYPNVPNASPVPTVSPAQPTLSFIPTVPPAMPKPSPNYPNVPNASPVPTVSPAQPTLSFIPTVPPAMPKPSPNYPNASNVSPTQTAPNIPAIPNILFEPSPQAACTYESLRQAPVENFQVSEQSVNPSMTGSNTYGLNNIDPQPQQQAYMVPQPRPFSAETGSAGVPDLSVYSYPGNLPGALRLIEQAVTGENEDRMFYSYLISIAPSENERQIISGIRDDEISHFALFRTVYYELTGRMLPAVTGPGQFTPPRTYCDGIKRALMGEQNAVQKYRLILFALQSREHINILTKIITDELRHALLYNYIYSKNGCKS